MPRKAPEKKSDKQKNRLVTLSAGLLTGAILAGYVAPVEAVTKIGQVDAKVVKDFAVSEQQLLDFGSFALINPTASGSFAVQTNGSVAGQVNTLQVSGSGPSNGVFRILSLTPGQTFVISDTGAGTAIIKNTGSTSSMTVSSFQIGCGDFGGPASTPATGVSCTATGAQSSGNFKVGAKLNVKGNQAAGTYTGTYHLIVNML